MEKLSLPLRQDATCSPKSTGTDSVTAWAEERRAELTALATQRITAMFGCYRKDEVADPDVFMVAAVATLIQFSEKTIITVTDPVHGMPATHKWFPSISEIREVCVWEQAKQDREMESNARRERQLLLRDDDKAIAEDRKTRPTYEELRAKHGETWGIDATTEAFQTERRNELLNLIERAGKSVFARECEQAGMSPSSAFSPSLAKLLARQLNDRAESSI